jgi:hypothetical protein
MIIINELMTYESYISIIFIELDDFKIKVDYELMQFYEAEDLDNP